MLCKKSQYFINYLVLKYISKINIFACILLSAVYLLNYCVRKVNVLY